MLDDLLLADSLLLLVRLLGRLGLGRFPVLKHAKVVPEAVEEAAEGLALALDVGLRELDGRPI